MREETENWLKYSIENYKAAKILLKSGLFNPCLQNIQQSIEKALKAVMIEKSIALKKTHSILELKTIAQKEGIVLNLTDDECDFMDSIYLPSKYPIASVIPQFYPDESICKNSIKLAKKVIDDVKEQI